MADCYVYIIAHAFDDGARGPVKIGVASDPAERLKALQTGNPHPLNLYSSYAVPDQSIALEIEKAFHAVNDDLRLMGEWFNIEPMQAEFLMYCNFGGALSVKTDLSNEEITEMLPRICKPSWRKKDAA